MATPDADGPVVEWRGRVEYHAAEAAMRRYTETRDAASPDRLWLLEHPPVFTLGLAGRSGHLLDPGDIPVVRTDRGGQVTYHGPGQLVVYTLLDLRRLGLGVKALVRLLEQAVIDALADWDLPGERRPGAPGVYLAGRKIAALGLRVRRGCSYHGLALNVDPDLAPFGRIDPCGYPGLEVTSLAREGRSVTLRQAGAVVAAHLRHCLSPAARGHETMPG